MADKIVYRLTWIDADGVALPLTPDRGFQVERGLYGLDAPPVMLNTEPVTTDDGSLLVHRRTEQRSVLVPLFVNLPTVHPRQLVGHLARVFRGPGRLQVSDGYHIRELRNVYYEAGLEGDEGRNVAAPGAWRKVVVSLLALDPWWYDIEGPQSQDLETAIGIPAFTSVTVEGDADALPVWTFTGPWTTCAVGFTVGSGGTIELATGLGPGMVMYVDTRPGELYGPRLDGFDVDWTLLTADSRLPKFPTGQFTLITSGTGNDSSSSVAVEWGERWLTP